MTDLQSTIAKIRELLPKVSEGPWCAGHLCDEEHPCNCRCIVNEGYTGAICTVHVDNGLSIGEGGNDAPPLSEAKANLAYIALLNPVTIAVLLDRVDELERERDEARLAIEWANNSLFGSKSFFLSTNGGDADPHHLDRAIEELKRLARSEALEEAAKLIEDGYPRPGISSKTDKCPHDKFKWEECEGCAAWAIRKLAEQSSPPSQTLSVGGKFALGDHGTGDQAIAWVLHHADFNTRCQPDQFLLGWEQGDLAEYPEFYEWLAEQCAPPPRPHVMGAYDDIRRAAGALLDTLWLHAWSGSRTHEENWQEMDRRFPQARWLHTALKTATATSEGSEG